MNTIALATNKANEISSSDHDRLVEYHIDKDDPSVDENLRRLQEVYGKEYLDSLEDREFYQLYKKHIWSQGYLLLREFISCILFKLR